MKIHTRTVWHVFGAIIIIVVLAGLFQYTNSENLQNAPNTSSTTQTPVTPDGFLKAETDRVDLGDIPINGGKVETRFSFSNTGTVSITVLSGKTSCMCTEAVIQKENGQTSGRIKMPGHGPTEPLNISIDPNEKATLLVTFDPLAHGPDALGPIQREVRLETNAKENAVMRFTFEGNVVKSPSTTSSNPSTSLLIPLTIISDSTCPECDSKEIEAWVKGELNTEVTVQNLEYSSQEAQALLKEYGGAYLPFFLLGKEVEQNENFEHLTHHSITAANDRYIVDLEKMGKTPGRSLNAPSN